MNIKDAEIKLKNGNSIKPEYFYFDAYGCIRYFSDYTIKADELIIKCNVHIIPISNIEEIIIKDNIIKK